MSKSVDRSAEEGTMGISELISAFATTVWKSQLQHLTANEAAPAKWIVCGHYTYTGYYYPSP